MEKPQKTVRLPKSLQSSKGGKSKVEVTESDEPAPEFAEWDLSLAFDGFPELEDIPGLLDGFSDAGDRRTKQ